MKQLLRAVRAPQLQRVELQECEMDLDVSYDVLQIALDAACVGGGGGGTVEIGSVQGARAAATFPWLLPSLESLPCIMMTILDCGSDGNAMLLIVIITTTMMVMRMRHGHMYYVAPYQW